MKPNKKIDNMTFEELKAIGLCEIVKEDFNTTFAKSLSKNTKRLEAFKKRIINDYNKTKNIHIFLDNLKIVAMAEKKVSELAKAAKVDRSSAYKILSKDSNPSFYSVVSFAHNLGLDFRLSQAK
jgi:DNA-binding phage protein